MRSFILTLVLAYVCTSAGYSQVYLRNWDNAWVLTNAPRPDFARIRRYKISHKEEYRKLVRAAAEKYGLSYELLDALIVAESDYDPRCVSNKGAVGLAQLMPKTAAGLGVTDSFDPAQNIDGGARYLKEMIDRFGDVRLALAAYNAGPFAVDKYQGMPPYLETQQYVRTIGKKIALDTMPTRYREKGTTQGKKRHETVKVKKDNSGTVILSN